jgi:hypothetical protein
MNGTTLEGRRMKIRMGTIFQTVTFTAKIIRDDGDTVSVRIPRQIRELKWTEFPEAAYKFKRETAASALVA